MSYDEYNAEQHFAESAKPRFYCPLCETSVDPVKEFVSPQRCQTHLEWQDLVSPDYPIAQVGAAYLSGSGDVDPVLGRAIERVIRDAEQERRDHAA